MKVIELPQVNDAEQYTGSNLAAMQALCVGTPAAIETVDGELMVVSLTVDPPMPVVKLAVTDWLVRDSRGNFITHHDDASFAARYSEKA